MAVFKLPVSVIKSIEKLFKDLLWNKGEAKLPGKMYEGLKMKVVWD